MKVTRYGACLLGVCGMFLFYSFVYNKDAGYAYRNAALPVNERVADLLKRMTVTEKIKQLDMYWGKEVANMQGHEAASWSPEKTKEMIGTEGIGSVHDLYPLTAGVSNDIQRYAMEHTRLGIPVLFIEEGLHGYSGLGSTEFPVPLQLSAMWDTALVYKAGRTIATETRAHGVDMILGPVLDLARDPRWGRVEETYGEDPYLNARNGVAMVKGLQGTALNSDNAVVSEPKHFAVHSVPEGGANISAVNMGEREARSSFLYVFEKAVKEGKAKGIMAAYHELDGVPCVDNKWLLTDVLRKEWGFNGFVLSDLGAIKMSLEAHQVADDMSDALAETLKAGLDMQFYDFAHADFMKAMQQAVSSKNLSMQELDRAVGDVLRVKFMLGLFDHPYTDTQLKNQVFHTPEHAALALQAAQEGIVLLKNDNKVLPLRANEGSIAVIGALATSNYVGGYANDSSKGVSILDALKQRTAGKVNLAYEPGYADSKAPAAEQQALLQKAVAAARNADVAVVVLGEESAVIGEGKDRAHLDLGQQQIDLMKALVATGKPVVAVLFNGRPLTLGWVADNVPAIVESWFGGEAGGLATADVLLGNINPSGKLPICFPRSVGQLPFYYNRKPTTSHKYVDEADTPLYPFGHGLSYTQFNYSDITVQPAVIPVNGKATVTVHIKNTGTTAGSEVVQLYIRDRVGSVTTPVKSLRGFSRIYLKSGGEGTVQFTLGAEELALWNREMKHVVEPGWFTVMAGSSSADIRQVDSLRVR
ncbi:glycoside hydrolase family 3 N-terminal domain-containing protein [Deminuibacter soli]|uniref:Beta-glucosidase n=1 Tax=Deminuibacter soli TaxID=2291815 RepID=A0A3E1NKT3_9BACT|nr:glycoside hydrolase family 3 N-terminal domain-containing protein [Deminuibacter soli]RFM28501.1 beta-glucosidase [Deminuibacter soli]